MWQIFTSTLPRLACVVIQIQILVFSRKHCTESTLPPFLLFCNSQLFLSSRTNRAMARVICFRSDQLSTCVLQNCSWSLTTAGASLDKYCVFIALTRLASFAQTTPTLARNLQSVTSWCTKTWELQARVQPRIGVTKCPQEVEGIPRFWIWAHIIKFIFTSFAILMHTRSSTSFYYIWWKAVRMNS